MEKMISAVNYHLWEPCNMRCKFCFATFQDVKKTILPKGHLPKDDSIRIIEEIVKFGFKKITFVGGEPTLCPWLFELIKKAKELGLTTMIVTNGSNLTQEFLTKSKKYLDWVTISIDSIIEETNVNTGRAVPGKGAIKFEEYKSIFDLLKEFNYKIKINTVASSKNITEDLTRIIHYAQPKRWKIFQVLPIKGQNDKHIEELTITDREFQSFIEKQKRNIKGNTIIVTERNDEMRGSYAMIDPAGRFFDNINEKHTYSLPILEIGVSAAFHQVNVDYQKFVDRGGIYNWK